MAETEESMAQIGLPRLRTLSAVLLLAGCVAPSQPPQGYARLPSDAVVGAGDPTRAAILNTAYAFGNPGSLAGRPAEAARAVANYEFIATELPYGARWRGLNGTVPTDLAAGLQELRPAVGIAPNAPAQAVVDGLYAASRALRAGDQVGAERILSLPVFTAGGPATLQRLAALPPLPRVAFASQMAAQEMDRQDRLGSPRGSGGDGGGSGRP
jgi:hypothetical protein